MTDQVEKSIIEYFPTDYMWVYFIAKPTQGEKFRVFRNYVLVEIDKVELVSEGHVKKNIHGNEIIICCLILINIVNGRSMFESADKCK